MEDIKLCNKQHNIRFKAKKHKTTQLENKLLR